MRRAAGAVAAAVLAGLVLAPAEPAQAAFPGENGRILFHVGFDGDSLWSVQPDGTGPLELAALGESSGAWSPDGGKIAFGSARDGDACIYVMNADGTGVEQRTDGECDDLEPTWSPDGTQIAFVARRDGDAAYQLWMMNADGSMATKLTETAWNVRNPSWSPDGTAIAFDGDELGERQIYRLDLEGREVVRLTGDAINYNPDWSPGGERLAFVRVADGSPGIYAADPTPEAEILPLVVNPDFAESDPAWSPDGTKLVFSSNRGGFGANLWVLELATSGLTQLTQAESSTHDRPDWQPLPREGEPPAEGVDLRLTKSDSPDPVDLGENLTYTLEVVNAGSEAATEVQLVDTLPPSVEFRSAVGSPGVCDEPSGAVVTCSLAELGPGASWTVTIVVRPQEPGMIVNTAEVGSAEEDANPDDNTAVATTTVAVFELGTPFVVNTTEDVVDEDGCTAERCSLREAILAANASPGEDTIAFAIGDGPQTIALGSPLPAITEPVTIDGTTQPGFLGFPLIELDGNDVDGHGLVLLGQGSTVRALVVNRFSVFARAGISLEGSGGHAVEGSFLGTNAAGTGAAGNSIGVRVASPGNRIGGTGPGAGNVISGNVQWGILADTFAVSGTVIEGNLVGTNAAGTAAVANNTGIGLFFTSDDVIGGTAEGARNVVSGNDSSGISLRSAVRTAVRGNYIGLTAAGSGPLGNAVSGISVFASGGADVLIAGNVISGNGGIAGVSISDTLGAPSGTVVEGNLIGTDATGAAPVANGTGVQITGGTGTRIGGTEPGSGNVVSGNTFDGIRILGSTGTAVEGNLIGTNPAGSAALPNGNVGVRIGAAAVAPVIGGASAGAGNVVSGNGTDPNSHHGILVATGASGATIQGNRIGTDAPGAAAIPNAGSGVLLDGDANLVGGTASGARNVLSANGANGIIVRGGANVIRGNHIGADASGAAPLGNAQSGVLIASSASGTAVGGVEEGAGNVIAHNNAWGVFVFGGTGHAILGNSIHSNAQLGIDLGPQGVNPNDPGDTDGGPNNGQNFPELTVALAGSPARASGTLDSTRSATFRVELFASAACDSSGHGEGERFLGAASVEMPADGPASFAVELEGASLSPGEVVTATATDPDGNTSEFSACVEVTAAETVLVVNTTDDEDDGGCAPRHCSLREAINAANASADEARIEFDIPGEGVRTITPSSPLPAITGTVTIDGYSQPGASPNTAAVGTNATLLVEVDNSLVEDHDLRGVLTIAGSGTVVRGLVLNRGLYGVIIRGTSATGNRVEGNFIGTDPGGTEGRTNEIYGVLVGFESSGNTVGGAAAAQRNLISGNVGSAGDNGNGVGLALGASSNAVFNNLIGTTASGVEALPNARGVIVLSGATDNVVGRDDGFGSGNVIAGNLQQGVQLQQSGTTGNVVQGNLIGLDAARDPLPNATGILFTAQAAGNAAIQNEVAFNAGVGVFVLGDTTVRNRILENSIHSNGALGIDLAPQGVNPNDPGDTDGGPNNGQNFPELTVALAGSPARVSGTLDSTRSATFRVELFASPVCDSSGHGEGERFLGAASVEMPSDGPASFDVELEGSTLAEGEVVTATATDPDGNTSEFSECASVESDVEATLELEAEQESVEAGAGRVRLADVPPAALFGGVPGVAAAPLANIPLANIPLANIDLRHSPLANIPLANIGLASVIDGPLGDIALSSIPLTTPGGWAGFLEGTIYADVPLHTVTLRDVYSLPPADVEAIEGGLTLGHVSLAGSRAGSLPLAALALGATPLANIPLANIGLSLGDLCAALSGPPVNCSDPADLVPQSVLGLTLQGAPLANIPLANIPLANIPLANIPLANIPLANIPLANIPLANIPLANIPLANIPLANIPLANIPLANIPLANILASAPLANIPLANIPLANIPLANIGSVVDCDLIDCAGTATLGDAFAAGAIRADARLEHLIGAFGDLTLGQLGHYGDVTLGEVWEHLPATLADVWDGIPGATLGDLWPVFPPWVTLGDVLLLFLAPEEFPWEQISFDEFNPALYATGGSRLVYGATFTIEGGPAVGTARLNVRLPNGFAFVPGSALLQSVAPAGEDRPLGDPEVDGSLLEFTLDKIDRGTTYRLVVEAHPSIVLGIASASATAEPLGGVETVEVLAETEVTDTFEPNDDPDTAPILEDDSFYLSYVTSRDDVDYFRFPIPAAGTRVVVRLSHLPEDYDLAVYGPARHESPRDAPEGIPLDGVPLGDDGAGFDALQKALAPEALDDVPLLRDRPLWGLSINRGTTDEDVAVVSDGEEGFYTIQVSGYNGASSPQPYMLRVQVVAPRVLPPCSPRSFPHAGAPGTMPAGLPAGLNTVFLVNEERLQATYGAAAAGQALDAIRDNLAELESLGFPSALVPVEADTAVAGAYAAWDADPCSPHRANAVVRAIGDVVDGIRAGHSGLTYVVLVGGDDIVPHARIDDVTTFANQMEYAATFGSVNNQYLGAFANGKLLTDNPYGTTAPIPFFNRHLYVPALQVGRLVETPADIAKAIGQFVGFDGRLDPQTSFTTGYDFLSDGAAEIHDHLSQLVPGLSTSLISETWTSGDVESALLGASPPGIASVNAHYDHHRSLPAAPHAAGTEQDLFTIEQVRAAAPGSLAGRILFTMGCHAGLSVADVVVGTTAEPGDWPQAFAEHGALLAGNTGFGLGDTEVVGYTEQLLALFSEELRTAATIAEALNRAKHRYVALQGVFGVYDEKVMAQMTLYGLPMYAVGPAGPAPLAAASADAGVETAEDPLTGIEASSFSVELDPVADFELRTGPRGAYYAVEGGDTEVAHFRPLQPRLHLPAQAGARGALITALDSVDDTGFDPVFSRPTVDHSSREPEISFGEVSFPTKIQTIGRGPDGESLVLVVGQFFTDADGVGVQRRWTSVEGLVYSSGGDDYAPPALRRIEGVRLGAHVSFSVDVEDAEGPVKRVFVLYRDEAGWHGVDLAQSAGATWTGGGPATLSDPGANVEYFVQAVDAAGNVAVSTRKGEYYDAGPPPALPSELSVGLDGPAGDGGWFRGPVEVTLEGPEGATLEVSVDGGPFSRYVGPFTVSGDGVHVVSVRGGLSATLVVPIDATSPTVLLATPPDGEVYLLGQEVHAEYACLDSGSGLTSCTGTVASGAPLDTATVGEKAFTVTASDAAGNATTVAHGYSVVYDFSGFFSPVANLPVLNVLNAGRAVPVKFGLSGDQDLAVFAAGFPRSVQISCDTSAQVGEVEETTTAGQSSLSYDAQADQYTYVWATERAWSGTCRQLQLRLADGTEHRANFRFR